MPISYILFGVECQMVFSNFIRIQVGLLGILQTSLIPLNTKNNTLILIYLHISLLLKISFYTALPNFLNFFAFTVLKCLRLSADPVTLKIKRGKALFDFLASLHQHISERDKNMKISCQYVHNAKLK